MCSFGYMYLVQCTHKMHLKVHILIIILSFSIQPIDFELIISVFFVASISFGYDLRQIFRNKFIFINRATIMK